jgi:hypothetical protein
MSNFFDKLIGKDKQGGDKKKNINNPFANLGKGHKKFGGQGQSLGGSKPGKVIHVTLPEPGSLGVKVRQIIRHAI